MTTIQGMFQFSDYEGYIEDIISETKRKQSTAEIVSQCDAMYASRSPSLLSDEDWKGFENSPIKTRSHYELESVPEFEEYLSTQIPKKFANVFDDSKYDPFFGKHRALSDKYWKPKPCCNRLMELQCNIYMAEKEYSLN